MAGETRRGGTRDKAIVAALLCIFIAGAAVLIGMQGQVGKPRAAAGRAVNSGTTARAHAGQVTEPLRIPLQEKEPGKPAAALPSRLHPTGATIARTGKLQDVRVQPPQTYRVTDEPLAARLYKALLSLDFVPEPDGYFCPMDAGISYEVQFAEDGKNVLHIRAAASGCRFVYSDDGSAYRENGEFRQALMDATGMNEEQLSGLPGAFRSQ
ncbi:hypothetical protein GXP70_26715 [Paenibacillus lycopersici]|uniref:Uncharacterized protein n=1 Tax=Paenibacillus lycopersici TaxID=2704462 RepID=A0A6C0G5X2_9BACL|nr:hypothetical protein [Paenibacillus lycopersici]QHT63199.1 hypothetical protein GXP70_26715 [Paenibacillus lycopersici]